jgi:hypothetical protein
MRTKAAAATQKVKVPTLEQRTTFNTSPSSSKRLVSRTMANRALQI